MKTTTKILILIIAFTFFYRSADSQWVAQTSGTTQNINALKVINGNIIYAVGNSSVFLKTTNGGTNWVTITVPGSTDLLCMHFFDASTGYVAGNNGSAFKTTNAGANWTDVSVNPTAPVALSIFFTSVSTGYMGNALGGLRKTTNGGVNWTTITSGTSEDINKIYFSDANKGWFGSGTITSTTGNLIRKTTNAGANWTTQLSHNNFITSFCFIDTSTAYATSLAQIFKTTNGGTNWTGLNPGSVGSIRGIDAGSTASILFTSGANGKILKSTNSGANWGELASGTTNLLREFQLNPGSNLVAWTVGNGGTILKTTNGGGNFVTAVTQNSGEIPDGFSLEQNYPNPFNPSTNLEFKIPNSGLIQLKIYDVLGNAVATVVNEEMKPGVYKVEFDAGSLPSGTYFYRLTAGEYSQTKKMILLK